MAPRKFSPEFRAEAVRAVINSSRTVADVAREYDMGAETAASFTGRVMGLFAVSGTVSFDALRYTGSER